MSSELIEQARILFFDNQLDDARQLLQKTLEIDVKNEQAWLLYIECVAPEKRARALEVCLKFIPESQAAHKTLDGLRTRESSVMPEIGIPGTEKSIYEGFQDQDASAQVKESQIITSDNPASTVTIIPQPEIPTNEPENLQPPESTFENLQTPTLIEDSFTSQTQRIEQANSNKSPGQTPLKPTHEAQTAQTQPIEHSAIAVGTSVEIPKSIQDLPTETTKPVFPTSVSQSGESNDLPADSEIPLSETRRLKINTDQGLQKTAPIEAISPEGAQILEFNGESSPGIGESGFFLPDLEIQSPESFPSSTSTPTKGSEGNTAPFSDVGGEASIDIQSPFTDQPDQIATAITNLDGISPKEMDSTSDARTQIMGQEDSSHAEVPSHSVLESVIESKSVEPHPETLITKVDILPPESDITQPVRLTFPQSERQTIPDSTQKVQLTPKPFLTKNGGSLSPTTGLPYQLQREKNPSGTIKTPGYEKQSDDRTALYVTAGLAVLFAAIIIILLAYLIITQDPLLINFPKTPPVLTPTSLPIKTLTSLLVVMA